MIDSEQKGLLTFYLSDCGIKLERLPKSSLADVTLNGETWNTTFFLLANYVKCNLHLISNIFHVFIHQSIMKECFLFVYLALLILRTINLSFWKRKPQSYSFTLRSYCYVIHRLLTNNFNILFFNPIAKAIGQVSVGSNGGKDADVI